MDIEQRLRATIAALLRERRRVDLAGVAKELAQSERSVQRHLQARGTSYARVLKEERLALAVELQAQRAPRDSVAEALGYRSSRSVDRIRAAVRVSDQPAWRSTAPFGRLAPGPGRQTRSPPR